MYEELIKRLRYLAKVYSICENENTQEYKLAVKAADATTVDTSVAVVADAGSREKHTRNR